MQKGEEPRKRSRTRSLKRKSKRPKLLSSFKSTKPCKIGSVISKLRWTTRQIWTVPWIGCWRMVSLKEVIPTTFKLLKPLKRFRPLNSKGWMISIPQTRFSSKCSSSQPLFPLMKELDLECSLKSRLQSVWNKSNLVNSVKPPLSNHKTKIRPLKWINRKIQSLTESDFPIFLPPGI